MNILTDGARSYQYKMVDLMVKEERRRLLILRYGTGKSWTILMTVARILEKRRQLTGPFVGKSSAAAVIFCRHRNVGTWRDEIAKRIDGADVMDIHEWMKVKKRAVTENTILLVPHHLAGNSPRAFEAVQGFVTFHKPFAMVCDESTKIKNPRANRTEKILALAELHAQNVPQGDRFCMTGQATPEGPYEIWAQIQFSHPFSNPLGNSYYSMLSTYFLKSDRGYHLRAERRERFFEICSWYIARMSKEMWAEFLRDNNTVVNYLIETYEESSEQEGLLDSLEQEWSLKHDHGVDEYQWTIQKHGKAQQIANGFFLTAEDSVQRLEANPKARLLIDVLEDLFEENRARQVIIWCHYHADYEIVSECLEKAGITHVTGPNEPALANFQYGHSRVILMPVTVSEGFNELAVADTAIFWSNVYSIETRAQAEHRMIRLNQKSPVVTFIDLCGNRSQDRVVIESLQMKRPINAH